MTKPKVFIAECPTSKENKELHDKVLQQAEYIAHLEAAYNAVNNRWIRHMETHLKRGDPVAVTVH